MANPEIVRVFEGGEWRTELRTSGGGGGGGGLPAGWEQTGDPASVDTNGGSISTSGGFIDLGGAAIQAVDGIDGSAGSSDWDAGSSAIRMAGGDIHMESGSQLDGAIITGASLVSDLDAGSNRVTNLNDPDLDQDAATKKYVDDAIATAIAAL